MGKILIFVRKNCRHCYYVVHIFQDFNFGIDIYDVDEKKKHAVVCENISKSAVYPQIFFGDAFFGSADEIEKLVKKGVFQSTIESSLRKTKSNSKLFRKMSIPNFSSLETESEIKMNKIVEKMTKEAKILGVKDRSWHLVTYRNCFVGSDLVKWLIKNEVANNAVEAIQYGNDLMKYYAIKHVCNSEPFRNGEYYYRLQGHVEEHILNKRRIYYGKPGGAIMVSSGIRNLMKKMTIEFIKEGGSRVDYSGLKKSTLWGAFSKAIIQLQKVDVGQLSVDKKKSFFLNCYNIMVLHGFITYGFPNSTLQRGKFYNKVVYEIGGYSYSLNDIEHGILRGNRYPPGSLRRKISPKDPRRLYVFLEVDPRLHFALNCGAKSCPPIKVYTPDDIDKQLTLAAKNFCDSELELNEKSNFVRASKIFQWYHDDFGSSDVKLLEWVVDYLVGEKKKILVRMLKKGRPKLKYKSYNWEPNV